MDSEKMYWLLDVEWVGPRRHDLGQRRHFIRVCDTSPRKNMSGAAIGDTSGAWVWCGTTNDWSDYGRGPVDAATAAAIIADETEQTVPPAAIAAGNEFFYDTEGTHGR